MSIYKLTGIMCTLALVACTATGDMSMEGPGLGEPISQADLAPWDISIEANGSGLPAGSGTVAQGKALYNVHCIACHGEEGGGMPNDRLVGGHGTLNQMDQVRTVGSFWPYATTLFDFTRRAMPFNTPQTLSNDEVYALSAYILFLNGIVDENVVMDAATLSAVRMPNADGFILSYP